MLPTPPARTIASADYFGFYDSLETFQSHGWVVAGPYNPSFYYYRGDLGGVSIRRLTTGSDKFDPITLTKTSFGFTEQWESYVVQVQMNHTNLNTNTQCRFEASIDGGATWLMSGADALVTFTSLDPEDTTGKYQSVIVDVGQGGSLALRMVHDGSGGVPQCIIGSLAVFGVDTSFAALPGLRITGTGRNVPSTLLLANGWPIESSTEMRNIWKQLVTTPSTIYQYRPTNNAAILYHDTTTTLTSSLQAIFNIDGVLSKGYQYYVVETYVKATGVRNTGESCVFALSTDGGVTWSDIHSVGEAHGEIGVNSVRATLVALNAKTTANLRVKMTMVSNSINDKCLIRGISATAFNAPA
jgi:hypothetical protein